MRYQISWCESKSNDWKVATLKGLDGSETSDVSINRVNKKGELFPNFDTIKPGAELEGDLWQSEKGKWYLFAPKEKKGGNLGIAKAQERKSEMIEKTMDRKEVGMELAATARDATLLTVEWAQYNRQMGVNYLESDLKAKWIEIRAWLRSQWGDASDVTNTKPF